MAKASNTQIYEAARKAGAKGYDGKCPIQDWEAIQSNLYKMGYTSHRLEKNQLFVKFHTEPRQ